MEAMFAEEWRERRGLGRALWGARALVDLAVTSVAARVNHGEEGTGMERSGAGSGLPSDVRSALRGLRRAPLFTTTAVLSLGLGTGGVATVYGLADRLLLRPLEGVEAPGELVEVVPGGLPWPFYQELAPELESLASLAVHRTRSVAVETGDEPRPARLGLVSGDFFRTLGLRAAHGRLLTPSDEGSGGQPVAVLSHDRWTALGAPLDLERVPLRVNDVALEVVGVAPAGFDGLRLGSTPAVWTTVPVWDRMSLGRTPDTGRAGWGWLAYVGRLGPGTTIEGASAELSAVASRIAASDPAYDRLDALTLVPARTRYAEAAGGALRPLLLGLGGVVALALLAAGANVANLVLARATRRRRELRVRAALGAEPRHLARLLLVESALLAGGGLATGVALAWLAGRGIGALELPGGLTLEETGLRLDPALAVLAAGALAVVTLLVGVAPALLASRQGRPEPAGGRTSTGGRRALRLRSAFVAFQVAVGVVLLSGTSVLGGSVSRALDTDLGMDVSGLGVVTVDASLYQDDLPAASRALEGVLARLRDAPGVTAASWAGLPPLTPDAAIETVQVEGRPVPETRPVVEVNEVGPGFLEAAGIPLLRGRGVDEETAASGGAVLSEAAARMLFADGDPLGARLRVMGTTVSVVGVVADVRFHGPATEVGPYLYLGRPDPPSSWVALVLRARDPRGALANARAVLAEADPRMVVVETATADDLTRDLVAAQSAAGLVLLLFAGLALVLALTGLWGVVAYGVDARLREFGVRLTFGAAPADVTRSVVGRNLLPVAGGVAVGAIASFSGARAASDLLYGSGSGAGMAVAIAAALVTVMATVAAWLPARRASRVNPAAVLTRE